LREKVFKTLNRKAAKQRSSEAAKKTKKEEILKREDR